MPTQRIDSNPPIHPPRLLIRRWLASATVVFAVYNPSGHSYYHWVTSTPEVSALQICVGILLFTAVVTVLRMAFVSLGYFGVTVTGLMLLLGIVLCVGLGLVDPDRLRFTIYSLEIWTSFVLAVGMCWSFVHRRVTGERDILRSPP